MTVKVAVASSDGKYVNQHFGRARQFLVFEVRDDGFEFLELRDNVPPCSGQEHNDDLLDKAVNLVADCKAVLISQIGPGAVEALALKGVRSFVLPDFIEDAIKKLILSGKLIA